MAIKYVKDFIKKDDLDNVMKCYESYYNGEGKHSKMLWKNEMYLVNKIKHLQKVIKRLEEKN